MTRVAAFDCGTNSLRLLIADLDVDAGTATSWSASCASSGSARASTAPAGSPTRRCSGPSPRSRSTWRSSREHDVAEIRFCATSATRDAENSEEFVDGDPRAASASSPR